MRSRILKGERLWVLSIVLTALLLVIACAPPTTLPPGEKVLEIGDLAVLTGGGANADQPCFLARQDYVRYFNEEKGIPGVTIKVVWTDTGTEVARFISGYRMLADRGVPVIYSGQTNGLEALRPQLEKDRIPFVTAAVNAPLVYPPGWVFGASATQGEAATVLLDYFMQNWREERPPRLQFFVMDNTWGRAAADEVTPYANSIGFEVLPIELSPYVVLDATVQLLRTREREADLVYIQHIITGAGPIMKDVERLGLQDKMQFAGTEFVLEEPLIEMALAGVEGFLAPKGLPWFDETEIPGVKMMIDTQLKYRGKVSEQATAMTGWVSAAIICEAASRALEEVGYENLDGAAVKRALESMQGFDVDGMVKITYGPDDRRGSQSYAVYQVQGGKIVRVTDYQEGHILVP